MSEVEDAVAPTNEDSPIEPKVARERQPVEGLDATDPGIAPILEWLNEQSLSPKKKEQLGLHHEQGQLYSGDFIGAVWLGGEDKQVPFIVRPKFPRMNYLRMYLDCAEHPAVRGRLGNCLACWPEQAPIESSDLPKLNQLIIAAYLRELNDLCTRHLRRHFRHETSNLQGKFKGKFLPHQHIKQNLYQGRQDRMYCTYQTIRNDIHENRVLRAALEQSAKFVHSPSSGFQSEADILSTLSRWIHASRAALSDVPAEKIHSADLRYLRMWGTFSHYRPALTLAKYILLLLGSDPCIEQSQANSATPPFALDSATLFERYTETMLRMSEQYGQRMHDKNYFQQSGGVEVCPDFVVKGTDQQPVAILDAKYKKHKKSTSAGVTEVPSNSDIYQMIAYSRHRGLLQEMDCEAQATVELALLYPALDQDKAIKVEREDFSFHTPLKIIKIACPTVTPKSSHETPLHPPRKQRRRANSV